MLISLRSTKKNVDFPSIYEKSKKRHKKGAKMNKKQLVAKISTQYMDCKPKNADFIGLFSNSRFNKSCKLK